MGRRMKVVGIFEREEDWRLEDENGQRMEGTLSPVAHLVASLVGCAGLTLRALIDKMKIEHQEILIEGTASIVDQNPAIVESISLEIEAPGADMNEAQLARVLEMTEKYCLIAQTLKRGPNMEITMKTTP
ncbi:MAG: OsmC family protein [Firmicutes bacterium]|jgi:uncharacterized OsmC-like protein|nr:OsmC family protein [Bacillota bacterium]MDD4337725.1 OsmC family protein [Bacillota bacterium]MDD4792272.1 OsmC family protein [Bacillota bacterium]